MNIKVILATMFSTLMAFGFILFPSNNYMFLIFTYLMIISIYLLIKNKTYINNNIRFQGLILGILASISYLIQNNFVVAIIFFVQVYISYISSMATFKANKLEYPFIRNNLITSLIIILIVGITLAIPNTISIMLIKNEITIGYPIEATLFAIRPGIWEEIFMRFLPYSLHIQLLKRLPKSTSEHLLTGIHMIIPHVLIHFPNVPINQAVIPIIFLCLFFGLPFTLLQKNVDLFTAIGSHFLVNWIRYFLFQM